MKKALLFVLAAAALLACNKSEDYPAPDRDNAPSTKADTVWEFSYFYTFPNYDMLHIPPAAGHYTFTVERPYYYNNYTHQNEYANSGTFEAWVKAGNGGGPAGEGGIGVYTIDTLRGYEGGTIHLFFSENTTGNDITNTLFIKFKTTTRTFTLVQTGQQTGADSFTVNGVTSLRISKNSFSSSTPITISMSPSHMRWVPVGESSWSRFYVISQSSGSPVNQIEGGSGTYYVTKIGYSVDPITITLKDKYSYKYVYITVY